MHCVFIDTNSKAVATIKQNLETTGLSDRGEVRHTDALLYLRNGSKEFDFIYVAPPQYKGLWIDAVHTIAARGKRRARHRADDPKEYEALELSIFEETEQRKYGNTILVFFGQTVG